jgi:Plasmid encoded RepA protein
MNIPVINLRKIDRKRLDSLQERTTNDLDYTDIWYIHTVLAQCFLPYKNPKTDRWRRQNGKFSISLIAGDVKDPSAPEGMRVAGLPYGAKPRLFQSYICTQSIKNQSPVIPVERSMTGMMIELGRIGYLKHFSHIFSSVPPPESSSISARRCSPAGVLRPEASSGTAWPGQVPQDGREQGCQGWCLGQASGTTS